MAKTKSNFDKHAKDLPKLEKGDKVRVQDWRTNSKGHWLFTGTVLYRTKTGRSYRVQLDDRSRPMWRNRKFLRPYNSADTKSTDSDFTDSNSDYSAPEEDTDKNHAPRRSARNRKSVVKYDAHRT